MVASSGYQTKQREIIRNFLMEYPENHVTADDVVDHLKQAGNPVGKSTVYRYLDKLVTEGFVRKYFLDDSSACYQYQNPTSTCNVHFHLKCTICKKLIHLNCNHIAEIEAHIFTEHQFRIDQSKTIFYGTCEACSKITP